jgi:predicted nucleic acid-binding protein
LTFIDSNIPMYLLGSDHPHKADARILIERLIAAGQRLVTDAEVMQEIIHRYVAIRKREIIAPAFRLMLDLVDEVFPVEQSNVIRASQIAGMPAQVSARDAVHIAVMEQRGVTSILTFDKDFDRWPGLRRVH